MGAAAGAMVLGAVGSIVQSQLTMDANDRAHQKLSKAIHAQKGVDLDVAQEMSAKADTAKFKNQLDVQKQYDPLIASLRDAGAGALADLLTNDLHKNQEDSVLATMVKEGTTVDAKRNAVRDLLLDKAKENLDLGAKLSPEYQAELIRSGLSTGSGIRPTAEGPVGVHTRELLGVQGEQLKMVRQAQAQSQVQTVTSMDQARANILANLVPALSQVQTGRAQRAGAAISLSDMLKPNIGMTGNDVVNLHLQNIALENRKAMAMGELGAWKSTADAASTNQMIQTGTGLGMSMLAGAGGGAGGGAMGGAGGGMLGSLLSNSGGSAPAGGAQASNTNVPTAFMNWFYGSNAPRN